MCGLDSEAEAHEFIELYLHLATAVRVDTLWLDRWPSRSQEGCQRWRVVAVLPNRHVVLQQENYGRMFGAIEPTWDTDQEARILPPNHLIAVFKPAPRKEE